jgi:hypothetical protein
MAKTKPSKTTRTIHQRFTSLERLVRTGFRQTERRFGQIDGRFTRIDRRFAQIDRRFNVVDLEFRDFRKEMNEGFAVMEDRIARLATHVDGFMKLHETLDIEVRVMKEQMNRFEERLKRIEVAQTS